MDLSWATQESEVVAGKVLRYRQDSSGWKKCREGVSEGLGGNGDLETAPGVGVLQTLWLLLSLRFSSPPTPEVD